MRRMTGGRLLLEGKGPREVARIVGISSGTAARWKKKVESGGLNALKSKPHPGPVPRLGFRQKKRLEKILMRGPMKSGFPTELWTCARVADVIRRRFGVEYHPDHVWRLLHGMGWTCQKPEKRARERDEEEIERWRTKDWARIKKSP